MLDGMTTTRTKIAVSLPTHLVEHARRAVALGRAASVSAYLSRALEEKVQCDSLAAMLDQILDETGGPMTDEERAAVDAEMGWG